jgi:hypothetical protein
MSPVVKKRESRHGGTSCSAQPARLPAWRPPAAVARSTQACAAMPDAAAAVPPRCRLTQAREEEEGLEGPVAQRE